MHYMSDVKWNSELLVDVVADILIDMNQLENGSSFKSMC
jgi:hypothetical protein